MTEPFVMVPIALAKDGHLRVMGPALPVYIYLATVQDHKTKSVRIKSETVAAALGASVRSVVRQIGDLKRGGYIRVERHQHHLRIFIEPLPGIEARYAKNVLSETDPDTPKMADLKGSDTPILSARYAKNGRSLNRKCFPDVFSRFKEGGERTPPPPEIQFLKFAQATHRGVRQVPLVLDSGDPDRVGKIPAGICFKLLRVAWVHFLRCGRGWLKDRPRTVALFTRPAVLNDYLKPAQEMIDRAKARRAASGKAPETVADLLQVTKPRLDDHARKFWQRCLDHLAGRLSPDNFNQYFSTVDVLDVTASVLVLQAPNRLFRKILIMHYLKQIYEAMASVDDVPRRVEIQVTKTRLNSANMERV